MQRRHSRGRPMKWRFRISKRQMRPCIRLGQMLGAKERMRFAALDAAHYEWSTAVRMLARHRRTWYMERWVVKRKTLPQSKWWRKIEVKVYSPHLWKLIVFKKKAKPIKPPKYKWKEKLPSEGVEWSGVE